MVVLNENSIAYLIEIYNEQRIDFEAIKLLTIVPPLFYNFFGVVEIEVHEGSIPVLYY